MNELNKLYPTSWADIRTRINQKKISKSQVAKMLGIGRSTLYREWNTDEGPRVTWERMRILLKKLGYL